MTQQQNTWSAIVGQITNYTIFCRPCGLAFDLFTRLFQSLCVVSIAPVYSLTTGVWLPSAGGVE